MNTKFYQKAWFIILFLIVFWPIGVILMWKFANWNKIVKIIISVILAICCIVMIVAPDSSTTSEPATSAPSTTSKPTVEEKQGKDAVSNNETTSATKITETEDYNKATAWMAVDDYCRNNKGWSITEYSKDRVEIKDGQYYVYVNRTMVDGSEGTFLYILEPYGNPDIEGRYEQYTLVSDEGQVFE